MSVGPVINECSQGGTRFVLKSKSDTHLSVRIYRPGCPESKKKFSAIELKQMAFKQEILSVPERFGSFVGRYSALFQGQENPLGGTHPAGFCYGIGERDPYRQAHPEWCLAIQTTFPKILDSSSYRHRLAECKKKLALTDAEEGVSVYDRDQLDQIKKAVQTIHDELGKKECNEKLVTAAILTLHERAYHLLVMPIREILTYAQSRHNIYIMNQSRFREVLSEIVINDKKILDRVLSGMIGNLEQLAQQLVKEFSAEQDSVQKLIVVAKRLIDEEVERALGDVERYWKEKDVNYCLTRCFAKQEQLFGNFQGMLNGRYASLQEIPMGFSDGKIHRRSYVPKLAYLLKGCEAYEADCDCARFLSHLRIYLSNPEEHLQKTVVPLLFFGQCVKNILLWPRMFALSDGERKYILDNLYILMGIANNKLPGDIKISYSYLRISATEKESAQKILKNRNASLEKKRQACRTLLHSRIPWQALCAVGALLHRSGGVPETVAESRRQQVSDAIVDLVDELKIVDQMIDALISFELTEYSQEPLPEVKEPPCGCYQHIFRLAGHREEGRSLEKINGVLRQWNNIPTVASEKVKFAMLRTLQILGEMCKNLGEYGLLSDDDIWAKLEELRDLLSHSERFIVAKRIERLLADDRSFSQLQDDFRALEGYFQHLTKRKTYLALTGLESIYLLLTEKIPAETRDKLAETTACAEACLIRRRMYAIRSELYAVVYTRTLPDNYVEEVEFLPLTKLQKEELRKIIQTLISPKAAVNNAKNEKVSVEKRIRAILADCKKSPQLKDFASTMDQALAKLDSGSIQEVQPLLQKVDWNDYKQDKIKELYAQLPWLTETVDGYVERKCKEFQSLLDKIFIVDNPQQLINNLQLGPMSEEALTLRLKQLGVANQTLWMQTLEKLQRKAPQEAQTIENRITLETVKKSAIECIEFILHRIHHLDQLYPIGQRRLAVFQGDPLLQLACEYLTADFRAKASLLEDCLETIRQLRQELPQQMIQEVQSTLLASVAEANEMLHVHDVTEPGTETENGRIVSLHGFISQLLINYTSSSGVAVDSFVIKLRILKAMLASL